MRARRASTPLLLLVLSILLAALTGQALASEPAGQTIKVAAFNIMVFGPTRAGKPEVIGLLAKTISAFDIVAIQEIRDKSGTATRELEAAVDAQGQDYNAEIGPRLGRTTSKEQYAYLYRASTIEMLGEAYTYPEPPGQDQFHREPFIAKFKARNGSFDFVLIVIHTDPDEAEQEIHDLKGVLAQAKAHFNDEADFIILGDLNADCDYYDENQPNPIRGTEWLIPNSADTTVKGTICTYDRIIITGQALEDYTGRSGVFRFDQEHSLTQEQAEKVSDHYPVYAEFYTDRDTD